MCSIIAKQLFYLIVTSNSTRAKPVNAASLILIHLLQLVYAILRFVEIYSLYKRFSFFFREKN